MNGHEAARWLDLLDQAGLALGDVARPGPWMKRGACYGRVPRSVFFPTRGQDTEPAKRVCRACPVADDCREYAITAGQMLKGIWGGTSERERRQIRNARATAGTAPEPEPEPVDEETPARPRAAPRGSLNRVLAELAASPGRQAEVARFASTESAGAMASLLRTGQRPHPPGTWVFEARRSEDGKGSVLYARLLPDDNHAVA